MQVGQNADGGFRKPVTEEEVRFIATSKWRVQV